MVRGAAVPLLLLAACAGGPSDVSRLTRLQVLAVVAEPPEIAPGATTAVTIWLWAPADHVAELMAWTCTDLGEGCIEAELPLEQRVVVPPVADGVAVAAATAPVVLAPMVAAGPLPVSLWVLACEVGLCPVIAAAREGTVDAADLADPAALLQELPLDGVSLVRRDVLVSTATEPNANPVFTETPDPAVATDETGQEVSLAFDVQDDSDVTAVAWTTRGALSMPTVTGDGVEATWFTEDEAGAAELWLVVEDGLGGSAVWRQSGTVEPAAR